MSSFGFLKPKKYAEKTPVPLKTHKTTQDVSIGQYRFTRGVFFELVNYVWRGGYPRWEKGVRPDYVLKMKKDIDKSRNGLFDGMFFEDLNQSVDQI